MAVKNQKLDRGLRNVLDIGTGQILGWIEKAQAEDYDIECLENAQEFLSVCINLLKEEAKLRKRHEILDKSRAFKNARHTVRTVLH